MLLENIKSIFNKQSFAILICLSAIIHFGIIASWPKIKDLIYPQISKQMQKDYPLETTIEFVLNEDIVEQTHLAEEKTLDIIEEIADENEELEEKKRQMFVDTTQLETDEESQVETEKIGEKGSVARDKKANNDNLNNEAFSEGESEIVSVVKGAYAYVPETNKVYPSDVMSEEESVPQEENQKSLDFTEIEEKKESKPQKNEEFVKEEEFENNGLDEEANELEEKSPTTAEQIASVMEYQHEELKTRNSEFERIIPKPNEPTEENQQNEVDVSDNLQDKEYTDKEQEKIVSKLSEREKKKIIEEISELYEEDINDPQKENKQKLKPKVSMSVNGKSVYNVPAPSFKADLSNTAALGEPSFNIKKNEYASYYKHIRDKISLYWMLYFGTDQSIRLETSESSPIIIEFKIRPSGRITDVSIAEDAGNPFLASRTRVSVINTQLDAFPVFIEEEFIDVRFNFYFF